MTDTHTYTHTHTLTHYIYIYKDIDVIRYVKKIKNKMIFLL